MELIRGILWDVDGVLSNILAAHRLVLDQIWRQRISDDTVCRDQILGNFDLGEYTVEELFEKLIPICQSSIGRGMPNLTANEATQLWCELYPQASLQVGLLPGSIESLEICQAALGRDGKMAIVTNRVESMEHILEQVGQYMTCVIKPGELGLPKKPAPDGLLYACRVCGFDPAECVYVGDAPYDAAAAEAAGMRYFEILTGWPGVSRETYQAERFDDVLTLAKYLSTQL